MKSSRAESSGDLFNMVEALEQDIGALKFDEFRHGYPCPFMVVSTAKYLNSSLITKDRTLQKIPHLGTVW
jgi:hypothetical protein